MLVRSAVAFTPSALGFVSGCVVNGRAFQKSTLHDNPVCVHISHSAPQLSNSFPYLIQAVGTKIIPTFFPSYLFPSFLTSLVSFESNHTGLSVNPTMADYNEKADLAHVDQR